MSLTQVASLNDSVVSNVQSFVAEFSELENISQEQQMTTLLEATDIYLSNQGTAKLLIPQSVNTGNIYTISMLGSTLLNSYLIRKNNSSDGKIFHFWRQPEKKSNFASPMSIIAFDACSDCKRVGRAHMVYYTLQGAAAGGFLGGWLGVWAGAVIGFWAAGEEALACLRQNHCK